jgi:hypothetical protein
MCNRCHEILQGGDKECFHCKEFKHIILFEKPELTRCKQCVNARLEVKKHCDIYNCDVIVGGLCAHLKSKKHLKNMYCSSQTSEYINFHPCNPISFVHVKINNSPVGCELIIS